MHDLVNEVLRECESIVNIVAKRKVRDKMIVCGRAARWCDRGEKCVRRLLTVGKICRMSTVDYVEKRRN